MSNLIYIMGKSATGKDTIYQRLKEEIDINVYIPYTTRPKREGEKEGREYFFKEREQFEEIQKQGKIMERRDYNVINNKGEKDIWTYATVADTQWDTQGDFLSIGTLESYTKIVEYLSKHPEKKINMLPVYITINEQEREKRARKREALQKKPNYEEMERRLKADNIDFLEEKLKKAGILDKQTFENYDLDKCIQSIVRYIQIEREKSLTLREKYKVEGIKPLPLTPSAKKVEIKERGISD